MFDPLAYGMRRMLGMNCAAGVFDADHEAMARWSMARQGGECRGQADGHPAIIIIK
jgi:hypothetical protein